MLNTSVAGMRRLRQPVELKWSVWQMALQGLKFCTAIIDKYIIGQSFLKYRLSKKNLSW